MKLLLISLIFFTQHIAAQVSTSIDVRLPTDNNYGSVQYNNPSALGQKTEVELSDDEISGSSFWKNDWHKAFIFLESGSIVKLKQAKLNLKTNEVYFLDSNKATKTADKNVVAKIIFIDNNDSSKILAVFQKLHYDGNELFQVFSAGDCQLLKAVVVFLNKSGYNTLLGKDEYTYAQKPVYYFFYAGKISKIDVLKRESLMPFITFSDDNNIWLMRNRNNLKSEGDWINFLNYYNKL